MKRQQLEKLIGKKIAGGMDGRRGRNAGSDAQRQQQRSERLQSDHVPMAVKLLRKAK